MNQNFSTELAFAKFPGTTSSMVPPAKFPITTTSVVSSSTASKAAKFSNKKQKEQQDVKPKRPLSSYNFFFKHERQKILQEMPERPEGKPRRSHGKIGFADLARKISANWNGIEPTARVYFEDLAAKDKERYKGEMEEWKEKQRVAVEAKPQGQNAQDSMDFDPYSFSSTHAMPEQGMQGGMLLPYDISDNIFVKPNPFSFGSIHHKNMQVPEATHVSGSASLPPVHISAYVPTHLADIPKELDDDCKRLLASIFRR
jgi:hypothetical protein